MDKRIIAVGLIAAIVVSIYLLQPQMFGGSGFEAGGRFERGSHVDSITIFRATSTSKYGYYTNGSITEKSHEQVREDDPFEDEFCIAEKKADCAACQAEARCENFVESCIGGVGCTKCTPRDPATYCKSKCDKDYGSCEDNDRTLYQKTALTKETYFGQEYDCSRVSQDAMTIFGVATDICHDNKKHDVICDGTDRTATLSFLGGSISWTYPKLTNGPIDDVSEKNMPILVSTNLGSVDTGVYAINGWADTNIKYVSPDGVTKYTLQNSTYFDVVTYLSSVAAVQSEKDACSAACPKVTCRVNPRNSKSTRERQAACRRQQEKDRAKCLSICSTLTICTYDINGNVTRDACNKYDKQQLVQGETIYLFKDTTPRIYTPTEDFAFLADMRGGVSNTILCQKHIQSCGDTVCEGNESCSTCPGDCGTCKVYCGDSICNAEETCSDCPDCACASDQYCDVGTCRLVEAPKNITPPSISCTQEIRECLDGSMMPRAANCTWQPERCPVIVVNNVTTNGTNISYCGDGVCDPANETCSSCSNDCGTCITCSVNTDCPQPTEYGFEVSGSNVCQNNTCVWQETITSGDEGTATMIAGDDNTWIILIIVGVFIVAGYLFYRLLFSK